MNNFDLKKYLTEGGLFEQELKDVEDILVKAGFNFDDGILGGVGSGGAGYYDMINDKIYGYNQSGPWNEKEFSKFYDNFNDESAFSSNVYEKEFFEDNEDEIDYDMVQQIGPSFHAIGDDGYVQIHSNGDVEIYAIPQLSNEDGSKSFPVFKMNSNGKVTPQFSKDEMRKMLKDDKMYIL